MADEQPTIEEPKQEPKPEGEVQTEAQKLLEELNRIGISKPEQIQGMARASSESGRLANMVGELRAEISDLKRPRKQEADPYAEQSVNLGDEIEKGIERFWRRQQEAAHQQQQAVWGEYAQITSDEDYPVVKEAWDVHMSHPDTQYRINTGQTTPGREYNALVKKYYRKVALRAKGVVEDLTKTKKGPPHMESGSPSSVLKEIPDDDKSEKLKNIQKNRKGNDDDIDALLDALIPKGSLSNMR